MPCCIIELHERVRLGKIDNKLKVTNRRLLMAHIFIVYTEWNEIYPNERGGAGRKAGREEFLVSQFMRFDVRLPGTKGI